jgi:long-chain acyl-CoA synthetase
LGHLNKQLFNIASVKPEDTALIMGSTEVRYNQLFEAVQRLATGLRETGIEPGDKVALMLPNVPHYIISYYAILYLGAVVVPINVMYSAEEIEYYIKDSGAKAIIGWAKLKGQILPACNNCPSCTEQIFLGESIPHNSHSLTQLIADSSPLEKPVKVGDDSLAVINYTSGVADTALGAEMSRQSIAASAATCRDMYKMSSSDRVLAALPLFHPLGQTLIMHATLSAGATVVLLPRYSIDNVVNAINNDKISFLPGVPGIFKTMLDLPFGTVNSESFKYCISYGGQLPEGTIREFEIRFSCLLFKAYGLTEAGGIISSNRFHLDRKNEAVGLPVVGTDIQIRKSNGELAMPNENGEIWISGQTVMRGYFNRPEETENKLKDGWLLTGDIGHLDEDHYLSIIERKEEIIIKDGFEIYPHEIEGIIKAHEAISEVAVVGIPDHTHGTEIKVFVVLAKDQTLSHKDLFDFCRIDLPLYKCPQFIEFCTELPKSPTGRVLKRLLRNKNARQDVAAKLN